MILKSCLLSIFLLSLCSFQLLYAIDKEESCSERKKELQKIKDECRKLTECSPVAGSDITKMIDLLSLKYGPLFSSCYNDNFEQNKKDIELFYLSNIINIGFKHDVYTSEIKSLCPQESIQKVSNFYSCVKYNETKKMIYGNKYVYIKQDKYYKQKNDDKVSSVDSDYNLVHYIKSCDRNDKKTCDFTYYQ